MQLAPKARAVVVGTVVALEVVLGATEVPAEDEDRNPLQDPETQVLKAHWASVVQEAPWFPQIVTSIEFTA